MLCECGQREATVHETVIINGKAIEKNLCEQCAQAMGLAPTPGHTPLHELVKQFVETSEEEDAPETETVEQACPTCAMTWDRFKQSGLLGCAICYKTFEDRLGPLIERAHEGATHHVGKIPRGALERSRHSGPERLASLLGDTEDRLRRMGELRRQLAEAVAGEQFERAAKLRDELHRLGQIQPDGGEV